MNMPDKIHRKIIRLSKEITSISCIEGDAVQNTEVWYGMDTSLGDVPFEVQKKLSKFYDWIVREKEREGKE
jgi:hypothetical protein